jgi:hypothetical protein
VRANLVVKAGGGAGALHPAILTLPPGSKCLESPKTSQFGGRQDGFDYDFLIRRANAAARI